MAILAGIFGVIGRYTGRVLTTALGWASMLLFGRVPQSRQVLLAAATFGSLIWAVLLAGVVVPTVASLLLVAVPPPSFVDPLWIRLAMLAGAVVLPIAIGIAIRMIPGPEDRATGRAAVTDILRGYPLGAALAVTLVFLAGVAVVGKARSLARRWNDAHVPIVVRSNGYEKVVSDLEDALDGAGLDVSRRPASRALTVPARVLAAVAGTSVRGLVPDRLTMLVGRDLEVTVHLSDVARVELGAENYNIASRINGHPGAGIAVSLSPGADALTTAELVKQAVEDQSKDFPAGFTSRKSTRSSRARSCPTTSGRSCTGCACRSNAICFGWLPVVASWALARESSAAGGSRSRARHNEHGRAPCPGRKRSRLHPG